MDFNKLLSYLSKLKKNNNKVWFDKHKEEYIELKDQFEEWVDALILKLEKVDPAIKNIEAKKCVFRIYKDVRFSKDKTPYKTHFGAYIANGGRKSPYAGYYIHIEPGNSMLAGGIWMPESDPLSKIRQEIDYNGKEIEKILNAKAFKEYFGELGGEKLVRHPKDYPSDHPQIEILKHKSFIGHSSLKDTMVKSDNFQKEILLAAKALLPLNTFLNRAIETEEE